MNKLISLLTIFVMLFPELAAAQVTTTTDVGRLNLAHPDLGHVGGSTLHTKVRNAWEKISNNMNSRLLTVDALADSASASLGHDFNVDFFDLTITVYERNTGTGELTVKLASGIDIAPTLANEKNSITITNNTGSAKDLGVLVVHSGTVVASGGGGTTNLNPSPNAVAGVDTGATNDVGDYIDSGVGVVASQATTSLPLGNVHNTGIKLTLATGTNDYTRLRFKVPPAGGRNSKISYFHYQLADSYTSGDLKLALYSYSDAYASGETEIHLNGDLGGVDLPNYNNLFRVSFDTDDREYYELRYINTGATSGSLTLNDVTVTPSPSVVSAGFNGIWKTYTDAEVTVREVGPTTLDEQQIYLVPYKVKDGSWRLRFNMTGKFAGADTTQRFEIVGATFASGGLSTAALTKQAVSVFMEGQLSSSTTSGYVEQGTGIVWIQGDRSDFTANVSGDVALESKPDWADFDPSEIQYTNIGKSSPIKAGMIMAWPDDTIPDGWLEADGSAISRTDYYDLFSALGTKYGVGDGSTTFNLPDYRDQFLRGQLDASGVTGTAQADATAKNGLGLSWSSSNASTNTDTHSHGMNRQGIGNSGGTSQTGVNVLDVDNVGSQSFGTNNDSHSHTVNKNQWNSNQSWSEDAETRPKNVSVKWIVKAYNDTIDVAGFGLATAEVSGLVKGGTVPGQTSGIDIAPGYLGEKIEDGSLSSTAFTNNVAQTVGQIELPAGVWVITGSIYFNETSSNVSGQRLSISQTDDTEDLENSTFLYAPSSDVTGRVTRYVNVSETTTFYLIGYCLFSSGGVAPLTARSSFYAVRAG